MNWIDLLLEIVIFAAGMLGIWNFIKKCKNRIVLSLYDKLSLVTGIIYILIGTYFLTPLSDKQNILTVILGIVLVASIIIRCIYGKNKHTD